MKLYRINALLLKYFYITVHRMDRLFDIFYWPLVDLTIWGFTSSFITDISHQNLLSMLLGGVILWVFVWRASQDIAVFVLEDFWSKTLYHLFSSPVRVSEHVVSILLLSLIRSLMTFGVLSVLAGLIYAFNIFSINIWFIAVAGFLLTLFGWVMGLFVTSLILRYGQRIQVLAWSIVWVIEPFSCVFYPLSALPSWAAAIARLLPTTYVFENLRSFLSTGAVSWSGFSYALAVNLVLLAAVGLLVRASFLHAKRTGILVKGE